MLKGERLRGVPDGIDAARTIRGQMGLPVAFLTAHGDQQTMSRIKASDPFGYLLKPFAAKDLLTIMEIALYRHRMEQRMRKAQELILELSTPVLPLDYGLILVPLTRAMSLGRTESFPNTLLDAIVRRRARMLVLDSAGLGARRRRIRG